MRKLSTNEGKEVYRYLSQVGKFDEMITAKQEQIDLLRSMASSTALHVDSERVQSSGSKDKVGDYAVKIADLCHEINADIDRYVDTKAEVMRTIDRLESIDERLVLHSRYLKGEMFSQIAHEMHISTATVYRIHKSAKRNFFTLLKVDSL